MSKLSLILINLKSDTITYEEAERQINSLHRVNDMVATDPDINSGIVESAPPTPKPIDTVDELLDQHIAHWNERDMLGDSEPNSKPNAETKSALYHSLSQRMPEPKHPGPGLSKLSEWNYNGYNQALTDVKQVLKGYFES